MRSRNCEDSTNGKTLSAGQCYGTSQEYGVCWEIWGAWGECSTQQTCGQGVKVRQRVCSNGGTVGVDRYCLGLANQSTPCMSVSCNGPMKLVGGANPGEGRLEVYDDIHQQWTLVCADQMTTAMATMVCRQLGWPGGHAAVTDGRFGSGSGQFGLISVTCRGHERTIAECEHNEWTTAGICHGGATLAAGVQCDVNGVWSLWSAWSECSVSCENGTRTRSRQCDHPPRLHGGRDCVGETVQTKNCSLPMCPVDGVWTAWGPWHACSVTCGNGTQVRTRDCHGPFYDGQDCDGPANDTRDCMDQHCPVDGVWEAWSVWSECSLTCANGTRTRYRNCTGPFYEVDGEWLQWQAWGECSVSCGGGSRVRVRECKQPLHGGAVCDGEGQEKEDCNKHHCPIDGVWTPWAEWSECTVTCGNGTQDRNRTCVGPFHLGAPCLGEDYQIQVCMPRICPVDGEWMEWAPWGTCSVSCGGGTRERSRDCYLGQYGGANCTGTDKDTGTCNEHNCPVDGVWLPWSEWSVCSQTCGNGSQARSRSCDGPFYGGANCTGPGLEERDCNTHPCPKWEQPRCFLLIHVFVNCTVHGSPTVSCSAIPIAPSCHCVLSSRTWFRPLKANSSSKCSPCNDNEDNMMSAKSYQGKDW
ncbi:sco-spondin-like [Plakobranchus ocellatus]|uniref:Sco-spondin-like n=1 Tax=Plakobranchus ocellatus TaxID=259542 RepID=A0AAV3ZDA5_9GAST|nr:sco-spondin-like [Plakobranchus ocellatus]